MNIATSRTALATTLSGLSLHVYDWSHDSPAMPAAIMKPLNFPYHDTFSGGVAAKFSVQLIVGAVATKGSQTLLDTLISTATTGSAVDAIETAGTMRVDEMRNYQPVVLADGGTKYWSAELVVDIIG